MDFYQVLIGPMHVFDRFWRNRLASVERRVKIRHTFIPRNNEDRCGYVIDEMINALSFDRVHCNRRKDEHQ